LLSARDKFHRCRRSHSGRMPPDSKASHSLAFSAIGLTVFRWYARRVSGARSTDSSIDGAFIWVRGRSAEPLLNDRYAPISDILLRCSKRRFVPFASLWHRNRNRHRGALSARFPSPRITERAGAGVCLGSGGCPGATLWLFGQKVVSFGLLLRPNRAWRDACPPLKRIGKGAYFAVAE
jgi:hypothetical protein